MLEKQMLLVGSPAKTTHLAVGELLAGVELLGRDDPDLSWSQLFSVALSRRFLPREICQVVVGTGMSRVRKEWIT